LSTVKTNSINNIITSELDDFFNDLDNNALPNNLYQVMLGQLEKPLLRKVMQYSQNNQTKAAKILGINRGTLGKKLSLYNIQD
jgi:Fis family transcriptional regulator, factor for inversion stimulation protein